MQLQQVQNQIIDIPSVSPSYSKSKETVFTIAVKTQNFTLLHLLKDMVYQLQYSELSTLAQLAAEEGFLNVLFWLQKLGLNLLEPINNRTFLAHIAAQKGHVHILKSLSQQGAAPYQQDLNGITPLDCAKTHHQLAAIEWLQSVVINKGPCLPQLLPQAMEREEALKTLFRDKSSSIQVIQGMGGVGKTQLASLYAQAQGQTLEKTFVHWISADRENLENEWRILGELLGLNLEGKSAECNVSHKLT